MTPTTNAQFRIVAALAIVCVAATAAAQPAPETTFSFQARVLDAGVPADGSYDVEAALYDSPSGCCQVGSTLSLPGIWIADGSVTLELDFGALGDDAGWLEIRLRPAGGGAMTTLAPRFLLTSAPLATRALSAAETDTADDTDLLEGQPATFYMEWVNHTGVPGDLADGDDDGLADLSCAAGQVAVWSGGAWTCGDDAGLRYARTHVVAPVGDPAANGAALLAAMAAIPTPTAAHEARLVRIEPGRYDLGSQSLQMKNWVDVEGSGQLTTVIASTACEPSATLIMANDCALRLITIENTCTAAAAAGIAVFSGIGPNRLLDVTARSTGASDTNNGIFLVGDNMELDRVTGAASGATSANYGVSVLIAGGAPQSGRANQITARASGGGSAVGAVFMDVREISNVNARGADGTTESIGMMLLDPEVVEEVQAVGVSSTGSSVGIELQVSESPRSTTRIAARGDTAMAVGFGADATVVVSGSSLEGASTGLEALASPGSSRVDLHNVTVSGAANSITTTVVTVRVAGSRLLGGPVSGTVTCAGVSDETHTFYPSTCP